MTVDQTTLDRTTRDLLDRVDATDLGRRIRVRFNPRMRTRAGTCAYRRIRADHVPREFEIDLNPRLLLERHPEALLPTLAHELAHAVVRARHGGRAAPHGTEWKETMAQLGYPPERCHRMNVDGLARTRGDESRWRCRACGKPVTLGPVQTRRERRRRGTYVCLCGGALDARKPNEQLLLF